MNKVFMRKLKRSNKVIRYLYYFINILYIVSFAFFVKSLSVLTGIETFLRILITLLFAVYFIFYAFNNLLNLLKRKYKTLILTSFLSIIFVLIFAFGSYYINFLYDNMNGMTEDSKLVYTSYLVSLKNTELKEEDKIGIINESEVKTDNELSKKLYDKENLNQEMVTYNDYIMMLNDLYQGKIAAAFMPGNYVTLFGGEEEFNNIQNETKILYKYSEKLKNEDIEIKSDKDFKEPLTILLMGVDSNVNGLDGNASFNGDTLMLITFNPSTLEMVMVSIPRDTYVPIACRSDQYSKINSAAAYGSSCVINTVNNFLDVNIDYYVKVNFKGVVELVDALDGVNVEVEKPYFNKNNGIDYHGQVCEQNSDRQFGSSIVCMDPGLQTLNGEQALAYARNRHQYIGGDLDRVKHQQQVVEAIANKIMHFSSIKELQKIINAVSNNVSTNMDTDTMLSGYKVIKDMVGNLLENNDGLTMTKAYLETYSLGVYVPSQGRRTSAQGYYTDSLEDIKHALKVSLEKEQEEAIKTFSFNANTEYVVKSPGKNIRTGASGELLPSFIGKTVTEAENFCNKNGINLSKRYVDPGSEFYNSSINVGLIGNQSEHEGVLVSTVKNLTIYIVNTAPKENNNESNTHQNNNNNQGKNDEVDENIVDMLR